MSLSSSLASFEDVRDLLDRALASERGIKTNARTNGEAIHLRQRCYRFRVLDRQNNEKLYEPGHPQHATSPYDGLKIQVEGPTIRIEKFSTEHLEVEEL